MCTTLLTDGKCLKLTGGDSDAVRRRVANNLLLAAVDDVGALDAHSLITQIVQRAGVALTERDRLGDGVAVRHTVGGERTRRVTLDDA